MTVLERIKKECREIKGISITVLEQELGYSNGSLAKAKDIPSSRILEISKYLELTTDYILTGEKSNVPTAENISEHLQMISMYEKLTDEQKQAILTIMSGMVK